MSKKGFTLGEILIVVVILGIVAGLAIPMYGTMMETARSNEARASLGIVLMGEKVYKLNSAGGTYWAPGGTNAATINTALGVELIPQNYNTNWNVTGDATTFTATVCRGNAGNKCFTVNQAGTFGESGVYG